MATGPGIPPRPAHCVLLVHLPLASKVVCPVPLVCSRLLVCLCVAHAQMEQHQLEGLHLVIYMFCFIASVGGSSFYDLSVLF